MLIEFKSSFDNIKDIIKEYPEKDEPPESPF